MSGGVVSCSREDIVTITTSSGVGPRIDPFSFLVHRQGDAAVVIAPLDSSFPCAAQPFWIVCFGPTVIMVQQVVDAVPVAYLALLHPLCDDWLICGCVRCCVIFCSQTAIHYMYNAIYIV